jgi:hypothetical protein
MRQQQNIGFQRQAIDELDFACLNCRRRKNGIEKQLNAHKLYKTPKETHLEE